MINLQLGYHQLRVNEDSITKIDIKTLYEFVVMSFGLNNAQPSFMDLINWMFRQYLDMYVIVFINDIFIY